MGTGAQGLRRSRPWRRTGSVLQESVIAFCRANLSLRTSARKRWSCALRDPRTAHRQCRACSGSRTGRPIVQHQAYQRRVRQACARQHGQARAALRNAGRFDIGGLVGSKPSTSDTINVINSATEQVFFTVAEAKAADLDRAVTAARHAFDGRPWPLSHAERADYLRAIGVGLRGWSRMLARGLAKPVFQPRPALGRQGAGRVRRPTPAPWSFSFEGQLITPSAGAFGLIARELVGGRCHHPWWNGCWC